MSKVLIDRELAERVCHVDNSTRQTARRELRTILATPSGTPVIPVKAWYEETGDPTTVRNRSVGFNQRPGDMPLVLESDALVRIACLEGEIAKRDARIVELHNDVSYYASRSEELRAELSAIKAQEPVAYDVYDDADDQLAHTIRAGDAKRVAHYRASPGAWRMVALYAAPVSEAKAQGVTTPEREEFEDAYSAEYGTPVSVLKLLREGENYIEKPQHSDRLNSSWWMWQKARNRLNSAPVQQVSVPASRDTLTLAYRLITSELKTLANGSAIDRYKTAQCELQAMIDAPAAPAADGVVVPHDLLARVLNPITSEQYLNAKHELWSLIDAVISAKGAV